MSTAKERLLNFASGGTPATPLQESENSAKDRLLKFAKQNASANVSAPTVSTNATFDTRATTQPKADRVDYASQIADVDAEIKRLSNRNTTFDVSPYSDEENRQAEQRIAQLEQNKKQLQVDLQKQKDADVAAIEKQIKAAEDAAAALAKRTDLDEYTKRLEIAKLNGAINQLVQAKVKTDPNAVDKAWAAASSIIAGVAGGLSAAGETVKDVVTGKGRENNYDPNSKSAQLLNYSAEQKDLAVSEASAGGKVLGEALIGIGQTAALSSLAAINPSLPLVAMAAVAAGNKANEVKAQGGTSNQALIRGAISGGIEAATEKFPLDALMDLVKVGGKSALKNLMKQAGMEATEESVSYVANWIVDKAFKDPNATFSWAELGQAAAGGALSGGLLGGSAMLLNRATPLPGMVTTEQDIKDYAKTTGKREVQMLPVADRKVEFLPGMSIPAANAARNAQESVSDSVGQTPQGGKALSAGAQKPSQTKAKSTDSLPSDAAKAVPQMYAQDVRNDALHEPNLTRVSGKVNPDDSVGAAPAGFTGNVERGFSRNLASDTARHEEVQHEYQVNPQMYFRLGNEETLSKATAIMETGLESAKAKLDQAIGAAQAGSKLAPEMVPLSKMVADQLAAEGRIDEAERILSSVAVELTEAGQLGQAAAILRDSSPMAKVQTIEKAVDRINEEGRKRYKDKWKELALTDAEKSEIANIKPEDEAAFEAAYEQVAKRLGAEIPATLWEKISEVRRIAMLLNPKTQIRNAIGNVPLSGVRKVSEKLSGAIQDTLVKAGKMNAEEQTRTSNVSKQSRELATQLFEKSKDSLSGVAEKWDVNGMIRQYRKYFGDSGVGRATDAVREFTYKLLEKGDLPFLKSAFIDSAAQYMEAHGIKDIKDMPQAGIDFATQQAMEATFKDFSVVASTLNKLKKNGVAGAALDILFPFTTTPINVAKRTVEYSPVGLLTAMSKNKSSAEKIDALAKGLTGTGIIVLGALLAKYGLATAGADENKDKAALDKATGKSPYSIAGRVSYEWAQPVGTQLAMGAAAWDAAKNGENGLEALWEAIKAGGDTIMDMTVFSNLKDLFSGYGSPTETIIETLTSGIASQMTPSLLGAAARSIDPIVRATSHNEGLLKNAGTSILAKTPVASKLLPASVNVKGEETTRVKDPFLRTLQEGFNPANINTGTKNAVDDEIYRLYDATGEFSVFPKKVGNSIDYNNTTLNLDSKQKMEYQKTLGQTYYDLAESMMDSDVYRNATAAEQVEYLKIAEAYATQMAKKSVVGGAFKPEKYVQNAQKAQDELGLSEAEFLLLYEKYGGTAMNGDGVRDAYASGLDIEDYLDYHAGRKGYDADGNKSYTIGETNAAIKGSGLSPEDQVLLWLVEKPEWAEQASKIGVSNESYVKYKVAVNSIVGKKNSANIGKVVRALDIPQEDKRKLLAAN